MNIIAFIGSPRRGGNTELLLNESIRAIEEAGLRVRVFDLNAMNILPCQNCGACDKTGRCIIRDDMQKISPAIRKAHRIILTSPVFFSGLSAQVKTMIDRCQHFFCNQYLLKRPIPQGIYGRKGLFIVVGAQKKGKGIECSKATVSAFFKTISVPEFKTLSFRSIEKKAEILKHPTALRKAYEAGRELIE